MVALSNINLKDFTPTANISRPIPSRAATSRSAARTSSPTVFSTARTTSTYSNARSIRKRKDLEPEFKIRSQAGTLHSQRPQGHVESTAVKATRLPEFSYRKIVMKALGNVLLKVVTAPFSFLTGGGDNLDHIAVDLLQFSLNTDQYATLDKVADILRDKPDADRTRAADQLQQGHRATGRTESQNGLLQLDPSGRRATVDDRLRTIQATKLKSDEVMRFADSLLACAASTAANFRHPESLALYEDRATGQLERFSSAATARSSNT